MNHRVFVFEEASTQKCSSSSEFRIGRSRSFRYKGGKTRVPPFYLMIRDALPPPRMKEQLTRWLSVRDESYARSRRFYLRGLGAVYLVAILSWWIQIDELVGSRGLLPMAKYLPLAGESLQTQGYRPFTTIPTIFWLNQSDLFLHIACAVGVLLALAVLAGYATGPCLAGLWFIYLSFVGTGQVFMQFQWDILLVEAGFLAIFFAPWSTLRLRPLPLGWGERIALWLQWFLIAKLMFESGWVKLAWATPDQPEWWPAGTAMTFHYFTQPLPTWIAWWAHQLPDWMQKASLWPMYFVELLLPIFVCFGARGRLIAALGFVGLMLLILSTGNYTYFNWLTIVLCLPLVADRYWRLPRRRKQLPTADSTGFNPTSDPVDSESPIAVVSPLPARHQREYASLAFRMVPLGVVALLNAATVLGDLHSASALPGATLRSVSLKADLVPGFLNRLRQELAPWHLVNGYGLFRTITTERPEIVLQGSTNGVTWRDYDVAHKPGPLARRPDFIAPHQPRVAWQFWFAALERQYHPRSSNAAWMSSLVLKLLENDPIALRLFEKNPFPEGPPTMIRAKLFLYEFTTLEERRETGNWWKRREVGLYLPQVGRNAAG